MILTIFAIAAIAIGLIGAFVAAALSPERHLLQDVDVLIFLAVAGAGAGALAYLLW
jgi:hypothetical protein